jgi:hypothetical protein
MNPLQHHPSSNSSSKLQNFQTSDKSVVVVVVV